MEAVLHADVQATLNRALGGWKNNASCEVCRHACDTETTNSRGTSKGKAQKEEQLHEGLVNIRAGGKSKAEGLT